jgi:hypothetical protein
MKPIEFIAVMCIIIIFFIAWNDQKKTENHKNVTSDGTYCQAGFKWVMKGPFKDRQDPQLIGPDGGGIPCQDLSLDKSK